MTTTLNFTFSPQATQKVYEALTCLSRFSEFVTLDAHRHKLSISALNSTKSAYGVVDLDANRFFDSYHFVPAQRPSQGSDSQGGRFACRLQAKAFLSVFRQKFHDAKASDTTVEKCEFEVDDNPAHPECRILVRIICKHGVLKTYKLTYEEVDAAAAVFDMDLARNRWCLSSSLLKAYMEHFGPKAEQLQISSGNGRAAFTSYTEKLLDNKEILKHPLQTSVALDTADFEEFTADEGLCVAISLKDIKAITTHADTLDAPIKAFYSDPGRPLQIQYEKEGMQSAFTLMTIGDIRTTQRSAVTRKVPTARNTAPQPGTAQSAQQRSQQQTPAYVSQQVKSQQEAQEINLPDQDHGMGGHNTPDQVPPPRSWPGPAPGSAPSSRTPMASKPASGTASRPVIRPQSQMQPPSPPLPPKREPINGSLFLNYDETESEDDDDLGKELDNDYSMLNWDTTGQPRATIGVARDETVGAPQEEEEESGVGPTQQEPLIGLFD